MTGATDSPETARQVTHTGNESSPGSGLGGQVRNTVKDIVSILKGLYHGAERAPGPAIIRKKEDVQNAPEYWKDWRWQVRHVVRDIRTFEQVLGITFDPAERERLEETIRKFPLRITPYYLSLIDVNDYKNDPIFRQAFPSPKELIVEQYELADPLAEDKDSPCDCITHRYPDRVLFLVSNTCAMYCRHCTRKRKVGDVDSIPGREKILEGIDYIRNNPQIRDVLL
jgi:lysine 2,3-aminomutase